MLMNKRREKIELRHGGLWKVGNSPKWVTIDASKIAKWPRHSDMMLAQHGNVNSLSIHPRAHLIYLTA